MSLLTEHLSLLRVRVVPYRVRTALISAVLLAVLLTGCSGGAGSAPTATPAASPTAAAAKTAAPSAGTSEIEIEGAWVRAASLSTPAAQQKMTPTAEHKSTAEMTGTPTPGHEQGSTMQGMAVSAAYMVIHNKGAQPDRLVGVATDAAERTELHETKMESGVMKMQPVEGIDVPAGGSVELKPGGLHIMLIGLKRELKIGDQVELVLHFEKAGDIAVKAEVRES